MMTDYARALDARAEELGVHCVHAGDTPDEFGGLETPLVLSSAFGFEDADHAAGAFRGDNEAYIYGRWGNPTVRALETKLAAIEQAEACCATASGMAAIAGAILSVCKSGDHVVAPRSMYAESARLLRERLPSFGIQTTFVDGADASAYDAALRPETRVLYIETPSNPVLRVTDIAAVVSIARSRGLLVFADNTFATPFCQHPLALGVDLVLHSMTKALGGHGDAIGGAICGSGVNVKRAADLVVKGFGGVISPFNAWLVARGLRTFHLRQRQACLSAAALAALLAERADVARVHHPSLASHPQHQLAKRQMRAFGSLLSFELAPTPGKTALERGKKLLSNVRTITHAVSLGDVRSLIVHPASTTHSTMPQADREKADVSDGLIRLSVGIEGTDALSVDLARAIDNA